MANEKRLENKIKDYLTNKGWFTKTHGGAFTKVGVPDILACIKGRFVAIEVKRDDKKGRLSIPQIMNINEIRDNGGIAIATENMNDIYALVEMLEMGKGNEHINTLGINVDKIWNEYMENMGED